MVLTVKDHETAEIIEKLLGTATYYPYFDPAMRSAMEQEAKKEDNLSFSPVQVALKTAGDILSNEEIIFIADQNNVPVRFEGWKWPYYLASYKGFLSAPKWYAYFKSRIDPNPYFEKGE